MPETRYLFCFGLGYSAQSLARRLAAKGWTVAGTVRTEESAAALRRALPGYAVTLAGTAAERD